MSMQVALLQYKLSVTYILVPPDLAGFKSDTLSITADLGIVELPPVRVDEIEWKGGFLIDFNFLRKLYVGG